MWSKKRLYHGDLFDTFLRKYVDDSLTLDQACFEIIPSQFCKPYEFFCVDGATIRFASTDNPLGEPKIRMDITLLLFNCIKGQFGHLIILGNCQ